MSQISKVQETVLNELKGTLGAITHWMAIPLFLAFWICDIIYVPELKYEFLLYRLLVIPISFLVHYRVKACDSLRQGFRLAFVLCFAYAAIINLMIYRIDNLSTAYYAGLNLIAIGSLTFIPYSIPYFILAASAIYAPYLFFIALKAQTLTDLREPLTHLFFAVGTVTISVVIRYFNGQLRINNINSKLDLEKEIQGRDAVIQAKTEEAIKLAYLSNQFSPQVVDSIRTGKIDLNTGVRRSQICSIFIDIVNSTERVVRVDKDRVHKVISTFMEDTIKILLKYDITIDKFLGDGILAFSNDPIRHDNFIERALSASLEIREKVMEKAEFYERHWYQSMQVRVGISIGFANVGFYGNDKYYKSYTAIGPVVNLASRLCSVADPNQILCSADLVDELGESTQYQFELRGKRTLKGFGDDVIYVYELTKGVSHQLAKSDRDLDCPACHQGMLYLEADVQGLFVFKCRACGHIPEALPAKKENLAA